MTDSMFEPGGIEPPDQEPPGKLEFNVAAYGWFKHVHAEVDNAIALLDAGNFAMAMEQMQHIGLSFDEGERELELFVPEEAREAAAERATSRREAMVAHPLPPFPVHPGRPEQ